MSRSYLVRAAVGALLVNMMSGVAVLRCQTSPPTALSSPMSSRQANRSYSFTAAFRLPDVAEHLPKFAGRYRAIAYSRRNHFPNSVIPRMPDARHAHARILRPSCVRLPLQVRIVRIQRAHAALFFAAESDMIVSLALNEPTATALCGMPCCDILRVALPAPQEAFKRRRHSRHTSFVNAVASRAYERL